MLQVSLKRRLIIGYWESLEERARAQAERGLSQLVLEGLDALGMAIDDVSEELKDANDAVLGVLEREGLGLSDISSGEDVSTDSSDSKSESSDSKSSESDSSTDNDTDESDELDSDELSGEESDVDVGGLFAHINNFDDDDMDLDDPDVEEAQALAVQWLMTHRYLEIRENLPKQREFSLRILPGMDECSKTMAISSRLSHHSRWQLLCIALAMKPHLGAPISALGIFLALVKVGGS